MPRRSNSSPPGRRFHSLQATSQALQPMHTLVSVKKPLRGGGSAYPASKAGLTGPKRLFLPAMSAPLDGSVRLDVSGVGAGDGAGGGGDDRLRGVGARSLAVALDEGGERRAARTAAGAYVAGARLGLLDEDVGVEADAEQVVGGVAGHQAVAAPVVGQPHLVHDATRDTQRAEPVGDHDTSLDGGPRGDDVAPAQEIGRASCRERVSTASVDAARRNRKQTMNIE